VSHQLHSINKEMVGIEINTLKCHLV
jgi:hypothetical protein